MQNQTIIQLSLAITLLPLCGALLAGFLGSYLTRIWIHRLVILCIAGAFAGALCLAKVFLIERHAPLDVNFYVWAAADNINFSIGFLLDSLSIAMAAVVLFISLMVHIYTIGYMADDSGYNRFFAYVALFTFAMIALVFANNILLHK